MDITGQYIAPKLPDPLGPAVLRDEAVEKLRILEERISKAEHDLDADRLALNMLAALVTCYDGGDQPESSYQPPVYGQVPGR